MISIATMEKLYTSHIEPNTEPRYNLSLGPWNPKTLLATHPHRVELIGADIIPQDLLVDENRSLDCMPGVCAPAEGPHGLVGVVMSLTTRESRWVWIG